MEEVGVSLVRNVRIVEEENLETGKHFLAEGFELSVPAEVGEHVLDLSFPIPKSILCAKWVNTVDMEGDYVKFHVAPDTVVGVITQDVSIGDTVINVQQSVIDNLKLGYWFKLDDDTNSEDLGIVIAIDKDNLQVTVDNETTKAFTVAIPTYVKMTVKLLTSMRLSGTGFMQLGDSKIGASYTPANAVLRLIYNNVSGTAKIFSFVLELLY